MYFISRFKAAGIAPQSNVVDFLISHQQNRHNDSDLYEELEVAMKLLLPCTLVCIGCRHIATR
jgi:hypothetical protein